MVNEIKTKCQHQTIPELQQPSGAARTLNFCRVFCRQRLAIGIAITRGMALGRDLRPVRLGSIGKTHPERSNLNLSCPLLDLTGQNNGCKHHVKGGS